MNQSLPSTLRKAVVVNASPHKTYRAIAAVVGVLGAQTFIQAVNLLIGLIIVRHLGVREYAIYTIAGTLVGIGMLAASVGLHSAASYHVARWAEDRTRLAAVVSSASALQYALLVLASVTVMAVGAIYRHQFASSLELGATLMLVLAQVLPGARLELTRSVLYPQQCIRPIVAADTAIASVRLVVVAPMLLTWPLIGALPVLLGNAVAQLVGFATLRMPFRRGEQNVDRREIRKLLRYMVPLWPEYLYYPLQANIAVLLLAWAAGSAQVAEVGALTRLAQIVMILAILNRAVVQPYVARYRSSSDFRNRTLRVLAVYAFASAALLLLAHFAPTLLVLVLGAQYEHLAHYVLPMMVLAIVNLGGALAYCLCLSSGNTAGLWLTVPFGISFILVYVIFIGVTSVGSALGLMLLTASGDLVVRLGLLVRLLRRPKLWPSGNSSDV